MQIAPIQYLRAAAALLVVWCHATLQIAELRPYLPVAYGESLLFFVISGFVMTLTTHGKVISPWSFLRKRMSRVIPLYWTFTLALSAAVVLVPGLFRSVVVTTEHIALSLLFIAHPSPAHPETFYPLLTPGWTLCYEVAFYGAFALCLGTRLIIPVLVGLVVFGQSADLPPVAQFYTSPLLLEFVAGMLICRAWMAGWRLPVIPAAAVFAVGVWMLLTKPSVWSKVTGAALCVGAAVLCQRFTGWQNSTVLTIGKASYSLYLSHLFTLGVLRSVWPREPSAVSAWLFLAASLVACILVGLAVHRLVEEPLNRALAFHRRRVADLRAPASAVERT